MRINLHLQVREIQNKNQFILDFLLSNKGKQGLIYVNTVKKAEELISFFGAKKKQARVEVYHAKLTDLQRRWA